MSGASPRRSGLAVWTAAALVSATLVGCAPAGSLFSETGQPAKAIPDRTLVIAARTEGESIAAKALTNAGINVIPSAPFNAGLVYRDKAEVPHPELAAELPRLNSDSWRVFPDGRMETIYRLKPNLTWQDATPLSAEDFAFAYRLYATPALGTAATSTPINQIQDVSALDERTVLIRWKNPYAEAAELMAGGLPALPRHILEEPFQRLAPDALAAHSYWTVQHIGLGPYRVTRWDRGVALEAEAFDGYVRGRPKINRLKFMPIPDPNVVMANLLAEEVHAGAAAALSFQQGWTLKKEWEIRGGGTVVFNRGSIRRQENQSHPERSNPSAIMDIRVRRAFAHAMDKQGMSEALFEGIDNSAHTLLSPSLDYFPRVDRALTKYPHDLRRSEQLMNEAGLFKGADGLYASPTQGRLNWESMVFAGAENEAVNSVLSNMWRRVGFDMTETVLPASMVSDREFRAHHRTMFTSDSGSLQSLGTAGIPTAQNRWTGSNRGSWSNPEYDRIVELYETSLDREQRIGHMIELARIYSEDLPSTPIFYRVTATPHHTCLAGPSDDVTDIHLWEWTC